MIGEGVQHIGSHAFQECRNLASLTIGNDVESIGEYAFADCTSLAAVTIPAGVTSIAEGVFYGCTSLAEVEYRGSEQNRQKITIDGRNDLLTQAEWQYADPDIRIIRGNPDDRHKEYAYRTTVTFTAEVSDGADVQWYVDGQPAGNDVKLTVKNAKKSYTVTVVVTPSNGMQITDEEHVSIKTDFWSKIVWFFTHILFPARFTVEQ
ncbi:MAG: leucine-rich repeat domain-containing protein [Clostridia bacterium]|nr:leucine-rich repeat domain-containing protein [Clostridia bacterium]